MAHLYKFRQGWQSENVARFLLSEFAFISQPSTIADDIGNDFYCTLFSREQVKRNIYLTPKNSFVIQIKSSSRSLDLSSKAEFLDQLELPFFIGVVNRRERILKIYSGRALHLLFHGKGMPNKLVSKLTTQIKDKHYYDKIDASKEEYQLLFPLIAEVSAKNIDEDSEKVYSIMAEECSLIHKNISARRMGESILFDGPNSRIIMAGQGSNQLFRHNFCLRLTEVFYNLKWIFEKKPQFFSRTEFNVYHESWEKIRKYCSDSDQALVDEVHGLLVEELARAHIAGK